MVAAASLPLVNLFFILFRLWNNERTEPIQFLRSKRGPSALTVPESLGPRAAIPLPRSVHCDKHNSPIHWPEPSLQPWLDLTVHANGVYSMRLA